MGLQGLKLGEIGLEKERVFTALRWAVLLFAAPIVLIQQLASQVHIHGDHLYLESLHEHLFVRGLELKTFIFTQASFLFPDALVYLPLRVALADYDLRMTHMFYSLISISVFILLVSQVLGSLSSRLGLLIRLEVAAAIAVVSMFSGVYVHFVFWPVHHGVLIHFALWILLLYLKSQKVDRLSPFSLCLVYLVSVLLTFSDLLVIPQVLVPLVFAFTYRLVHYRRHVRRGEWDLLTFSGLGALQGYLALRIFHSYGILQMTYLPVEMSFRNFVVDGWQFITDLPRILNQSVFAGVLLVAALVLLHAVRERKGEFNQAELTLYAFCVGLMAYLAIVFATGNWENYYKVRYTQIVWLLPLTVAAMIHLQESIFGIRLQRGLQALLATFVLGNIPNIGQESFYLREYTTVVDCLDEHWANGSLPSKYGISDFWLSRLILFQSRERLEVMQVVGPDRIHKWMNSQEWYHFDRHGSPIESYSFLVTNLKSVSDQAKIKFGEPSEVLSCPASKDISVLLYPEGLILNKDKSKFKVNWGLANRDKSNSMRL